MEEYARDLKASVYLDPAMEWNYCGVTLCGDDESKKQVIDLTAGYNLVSFNADDMPFEFEVRCGVPEYYMYFDGELCSEAISSDMFSLIDLKDGSVVKLYAGLPAMCDVRLEVEDGVDAIVMHDIVAEVSASEALTLPAGTMITVKPATATEIKVMAGEREILADSEGAYNFIVEESCTIVVSAGTVSGISAIEPMYIHCRECVCLKKPIQPHSVLFRVDATSSPGARYGCADKYNSTERDSTERQAGSGKKEAVDDIKDLSSITIG